MTRQHVDYSLVSRHHDSRVRNLPDELRGQAPVHARLALLRPYCVQRLPERPILVALLPQPGSSDFVRVGYATGHGLGHRTRHHKLDKVPGRFVVGGIFRATFHLWRDGENNIRTDQSLGNSFHSTHQFRLQRLVDHKVDDSL